MPSCEASQAGAAKTYESGYLMVMQRILAPFRAARRNKPVLDALYGVIMAQARDPYFYAQLGVPDTVEGRFDMVTLHTYLVNARLRGGGEAAQALSQDLFDHMFRDMDHALREMGVGDMGIGKRIQKMASKFYGRTDAYEKALADADPAALRDAVGRNIYAGVAPNPTGVAVIAAYIRQARADLGIQSLDRLMEGELHFPAIATAKGDGDV
ncbi:ubiquinol-cytochrome C chaperone family protein [Pyruvatibacter sp.]|uniref:ubiquinol-cytochrome C chaperone family protein n=1 Tax=Pyruvatibacter sp. TaxID=1981328 RepID=UPI0032EAB941